jgi:cytochrome c peroxidase
LTPKQQLGLAIFTGIGNCSKCHGIPEFTDASGGSGGNAFANTGVRPIADDPGQGDGKFKTPTLRGVAESGPYMHNGGKLNLKQVVNMYNLGGDHPNDETSGEISPLGFTGQQKHQLIAFLLSLTDDRVRCKKAPFDPPQMHIPKFGTLPPLGAGGLPAEGMDCIMPYMWNGDPKFHFRNDIP